MWPSRRNRGGATSLYVFLYLVSACPAIWLIELDKLSTRLAIRDAREALLALNLTTFPPVTTQSRLSGKNTF